LQVEALSLWKVLEFGVDGGEMSWDEFHGRFERKFLSKAEDGV